MTPIAARTGRQLPQPFAAGGEGEAIFIARFFDLPHEFEPEFARQVPAIMMPSATFEVQRRELGVGFRENSPNAMPAIGAGFERR